MTPENKQLKDEITENIDSVPVLQIVLPYDVAINTPFKTIDDPDHIIEAQAQENVQKIVREMAASIFDTVRFGGKGYDCFIVKLVYPTNNRENT